MADRPERGYGSTWPRYFLINPPCGRHTLRAGLTSSSSLTAEVEAAASTRDGDPELTPTHRSASGSVLVSQPLRQRHHMAFDAVQVTAARRYWRLLIQAS